MSTAQQLKRFKDFNIKPREKDALMGEKLKMDKILNREIMIEKYQIKPSRVFPDKGNGKYVEMQIIVDGLQRVVFNGSVFLMDALEQILPTDFPFTTTIVKENNCYLFT